jgi:hypothetical protein
VAFWVSPEFTENNLCEVVRGIAGDLAEEVKLIDDFTHPKTVGGWVGGGGVRGGVELQRGKACSSWTTAVQTLPPPLSLVTTA